VANAARLHFSIPVSEYDIAPLTFDRIRTYPLASRKSKVNVAQFARPHQRGESMRKVFASLPHMLAADDLRAVANAIQRARVARKPILWGMGGHVVKVGLGPILIDLMRRGFVSGIAMNGAAMVHDFEIALAGSTSEDVDAGLGRGAFGMAEETSLYLNEVAVGAQRSNIGLGEAVGKLLINGRLHAR
jgi:hypothetical protein